MLLGEDGGSSVHTKAEPAEHEEEKLEDFASIKTTFMSLRHTEIK